MTDLELLKEIEHLVANELHGDKLLRFIELNTELQNLLKKRKKEND